MKKVARLSGAMDGIAGLCVVIIMALTVINILLRVVIKNPILGTNEYVGYLSGLMVSLSIAYCAVKNGHIAVDIVVEHFPPKIQTAVDFIMNGIALVFWSFVVWHTGKYAKSMMLSGVVSPTANMPIYLFVFMVGIGLFLLCLALLSKMVEIVKKGGKT